MTPVYFLSYLVIDNYTDNEKFYLENFKYHTDRDENLEPAYHYWILKNHGIGDIHLVDTLENVPAGSFVVCTHSVKDRIDVNRYKCIQLVTDDPEIEGCVHYLSYDQSVLQKSRFHDVCKYWRLYDLKRSKNWSWIRLPLPVGLKRCKPNWPPEKFVFLGSENSLWTSLKTDEYKQHIEDKFNIQFKIIDNRWHNDGDEDVMFGFRPNNTYWSGFKIGGGKYEVHRLGHKTPNRLYQAWHMNLPSMFENNPAMMAIRSDDSDYLIHTSIEQFENNIKLLRGDSKLFSSMVATAKYRQDENNYEAVTQQWVNVFNQLL